MVLFQQESWGPVLYVFLAFALAWLFWIPACFIARAAKKSAKNVTASASPPSEGGKTEEKPGSSPPPELAKAEQKPVQLGGLFWLFYFLGGNGPMSAALICVTVASINSGDTPLAKELARSYVMYTNVRWYVWILSIVIPLTMTALGFAAYWKFAAQREANTRWPKGWGKDFKISVAPILWLVMVIQNFAVLPMEEFGWRAYFIQTLTVDFLPGYGLLASLIVGITWGLWHTPLFFFFDPHQPSDEIPEEEKTKERVIQLGLYTLMLALITVPMGWLVLASEGVTKSIVPALIYHAVFNSSIGILRPATFNRFCFFYAVCGALPMAILFGILLETKTF